MMLGPAPGARSVSRGAARGDGLARQVAGGISSRRIQADLRKIHAELAPCDIVMADIQATTPDERVIALLEICRRLEDGLI